ncbi:MAG: hypothetical protein JW774_04685 [Candidatus Aureabacteria bacterium]|nr:hypothetical protein [Candidatus Auribacterota bacterium]
MNAPTPLKRNILKIRTYHQNKLMMSIFLAMLLPTLIFGGALYYLIDKISSPYNQGQAVQPELLVNPVISAILILCVIFIPLCLIYAIILTNRFVGPIERVSKKMDEMIQSGQISHIQVRPKDALFPLVDKINTLLNQKK